MSLSLIDPVHVILEQIEKKTQKKIKYIEKNDLDVPARIKLARKDATVHRLLYKKDHDELINYVIANQCGHIFRLLESSANKRFFPIANRKTMMCFMMEAEDDIHRLSSFFGKDKIKQLITLWYQGVVFQLTKMPPDLQIDKWLYDEYPELRPIQLTCIKTQLKNALQGISKDLRKMTPKKIYHVSNIMNFAFFKTLEDHFHLDFVAPYHRTIFIFEGSNLVRLTMGDYIDNHEGDRAMIDTWAEHLGLTTWFEWKHYDDMPDEY